MGIGHWGLGIGHWVLGINNLNVGCCDAMKNEET